MPSASGLTVAKLGGSHAFSAHLRHWIDALATCAGNVVVVPGGGPFADTVRTAQSKIGYDNRAAHHMALLAMEQYGNALASFSAEFIPAASPAAIRRGLRQGHVPIWFPTRMVVAAKEIPPSWDITSDSLAAWLAGALAAPRLLLVKHVEQPLATTCADELVTRGIVDPAFPRFLAASGAEAAMAGPEDHATAADAIRRGRLAGNPIVLR